MILIVSYSSVDQHLHKLVNEHFLVDNLGVSLLGTKLDSTENRRARQILESTSRRVAEVIEIGLL